MINSKLGEGYTMMIDQLKENNTNKFCFKLAFEGNVMYEEEFDTMEKGYSTIGEYIKNLF